LRTLENNQDLLRKLRKEEAGCENRISSTWSND
jgi:hypothetical protein